MLKLIILSIVLISLAKPSFAVSDLDLDCQSVDNGFERCENEEVVCYKGRWDTGLSCEFKNREIKFL